MRVWSEQPYMAMTGLPLPPPRRLLIIGDVALSRALMRMVLSRLGYVVTCVASAREATAALGHTRFALALVALHLPDGSGLALARRLREEPSPVGAMPILLFGDAWDTEAVLEGCREAELDGYLPKPLSIGRLVSSVCGLVQRSPLPRGVPMEMTRPTPVALNRLDEFTEGDPQLERELSQLYLETAAHYLDALRRALADADVWSRTAHALKGASANIGAGEMARLAQAAEHAPPSPDRVAQLEAALAEVRGFFRERAAETPARRDAVANLG
jgi:CheY-like chemotaxis protein